MPTTAPVQPTAAPTTAPTPTSEPNVFWFKEGAIVGFIGTPSEAGATAKMVVTKVSDNSTVEVSENNTFVMPAGEVKVEVVYEQAEKPYSEWKQGQAKVDTTDGSMQVVEFEGKTALDITGRNVYTELEEAVTEGALKFSTNVYAGPDTTAFRIYLENASASYYQDANNAVEVVYSDASAKSINSGSQTYSFADTTSGWYNIVVKADYSKVAADDFITVVINNPAGEEVVTSTLPASKGLDAGIKQIRLISRGSAGASDIYFADMNVKVRPLKPGVDDPIDVQEEAKTWIAADNYQELLSKSTGTSETKFDFSDMNMDNLYLRSSAGSRPINYEDMAAEQGKADTFSFPDGKSFPSKIFNFRPGTEMEFIPEKAGKLKLYYHGQSAGATIVSMTQGSTTVDGVIGDDATPDANGEYDGIVTFDVNAGENVVLKSISNGWLTAVSYIPEVL